MSKLTEYERLNYERMGLIQANFAGLPDTERYPNKARQKRVARLKVIRLRMDSIPEADRFPVESVAA